MFILKNTVQEYAWGSHSAIAELLGQPCPSPSPQAELWMGAHPKAPSRISIEGRWRSLAEVIEERPEEILGKRTAEKFENRLPFLFKVLAAGKPLSIQAHPNREQAQKGFQRENRLGIPMEAPERNYRDDMHKPECICAMTRFWALNGFRNITEIMTNIEKSCPKGLTPELRAFQQQPDTTGLKQLFKAIMMLDSDRKIRVVREVLRSARKRKTGDPMFDWIFSLHQDYPEDIGVLSPLLLNLVCLEPGQAMFLNAGDLHAYLNGTGVELMANSDNVLRGGLTPKHVDVPELLNVLRFEEKKIENLLPEAYRPGEYRYAGRAGEFVLSVIKVVEGDVYTGLPERSVEILLCTEGVSVVTPSGRSETLTVGKGTSVLVPAAVESYRIKGEATFFKASVPTG